MVEGPFSFLWGDVKLKEKDRIWSDDQIFPNVILDFINNVREKVDV